MSSSSITTNNSTIQDFFNSLYTDKNISVTETNLNNNNNNNNNNNIKEDKKNDNNQIKEHANHMINVISNFLESKMTHDEIANKGVFSFYISFQPANKYQYHDSNIKHIYPSKILEHSTIKLIYDFLMTKVIPLSIRDYKTKYGLMGYIVNVIDCTYAVKLNEQGGITCHIPKSSHPDNSSSIIKALNTAKDLYCSETTINISKHLQNFNDDWTSYLKNKISERLIEQSSLLRIKINDPQESKEILDSINLVQYSVDYSISNSFLNLQEISKLINSIKNNFSGLIPICYYEESYWGGHKGYEKKYALNSEWKGDSRSKIPATIEFLFPQQGKSIADIKVYPSPESEKEFKVTIH